MIEIMGGVVGLGIVALFLYQQHFYMRTIRELVERLTTRDLREYTQVKNPPPTKPKPPMVVEPIDSFDRIMG